MSLDTLIRSEIERLILVGTPTGNLTAPLINNLGRVLVEASRSGDQALTRSSLIGLVEIVRNELDEVVAHYDREIPR